MISPFPDKAALRKQAAAYVNDSKDILESCVTSAQSTKAFLDAYTLSLATHTVLGGLSSPQLTPKLSPARSIALRVPLLALIGQATAACTELRRFIELIAWTVYFTDHSVEWTEFQKGKGGFERDRDKPIAYAAHRELSFYLSYANELMAEEPSSLAKSSVASLRGTTAKLNALIHAGWVAKEKGNSAPFDAADEQALRGFASLQSDTFAHGCVLLAAFRTRNFDKLDASSRAAFDNLVGKSLKRKIRSGPFGLQ